MHRDVRFLFNTSALSITIYQLSPVYSPRQSVLTGFVQLQCAAAAIQEGGRSHAMFKAAFIPIHTHCIVSLEKCAKASTVLMKF